MQQKYPGMKVNCFACHVKRKPKTERNDFGKLFAKELKVTNPTLTQDWKSKKGDIRKAYEAETMVPAFDKALEKIKTLRNDDEVLYDDLIKNEKIPEIVKDPDYKPDPESAAEAGERGGAGEPTDDNDENGSQGQSPDNPSRAAGRKSGKG
jgi:hypothetical protein